MSQPHLARGETGELRLIFHQFNELRFSMSRDGGFSWPFENSGLQDYVDFAGVRNSNLVCLPDDRWVVMWTERNPTDFVKETRVAYLDTLGRRTGPSALFARQVDDSEPALLTLRLASVPQRDALVVTWNEVTGTATPVAMSATSFEARLAFEAPMSITPSRGPPVGGPVTIAFGERVLTLLLSETFHLDLYAAEPDSEWSLLHSFDLPEGFAHEGMMGFASTGGTLGVASTVDPGQEPLMVWFWESMDGGTTWSDPADVATDAPAGNQYDAYLTADGRGSWHCAWLRNTPFSLDVDVLYARREAGSVEWSSPTRVNRTTGDVGGAVGSTVGLVADSDGHAYITYAELFEDRVFLLMTTRSRPWDGLDIADWYVLSPLSRAGGNPRVRFATPSATVVTASLFDVHGRRVMRWPTWTVGRGVHELEWDGMTIGGRRVASGVYYWWFDYDLGERVVQEGARSVLVR